jgi:hypothetical protein
MTSPCIIYKIKRISNHVPLSFATALIVPEMIKEAQQTTEISHRNISRIIVLMTGPGTIILLLYVLAVVKVTIQYIVQYAWSQYNILLFKMP